MELSFEIYRNLKTGQLFPSVKDGFLINPIGKIIELNEDLFEYVEEVEETNFTPAQLKAVRLEKADEELERKKAIETSFKASFPKSVPTVSYKGCRLSVKDRKDLEEGKIVIVVAFRYYWPINIEGLIRYDAEAKVQEFLREGLAKRRQRTAKYRVIWD